MSADKTPQASFEASLKNITGQTRMEFREELVRFNRAQTEAVRPKPVTTLPEIPKETIAVREIKLEPIISKFGDPGQVSASTTSNTTGTGGTTEIIVIKYDSGAGTVSARRMIGNLTDNGAYTG